MTLAPERSGDLPIGFSDAETAEYDFSSLDEAAASPPPENDASEDITPETNVCPTCDLPVVRQPGQRGKLAKYHLDCKPSTARRLTGTTSRKTTGANTKASREADECIAMVKSAMIKGAMGLAIVDKYDGFVVMTAIPNVCSNLHGILVRYDSFRKDVLAMKSGGSIFGLIISILMLALPIAAHHGIIPSARLQQMLTQMPVMMFKIAQRMKEGEQALSDMMDRVANEMLRPENGGTNAASNGQSPTP